MLKSGWISQPSALQITGNSSSTAAGLPHRARPLRRQPSFDICRQVPRALHRRLPLPLRLLLLPLLERCGVEGGERGNRRVNRCHARTAPQVEKKNGAQRCAVTRQGRPAAWRAANYQAENLPNAGMPTLLPQGCRKQNTIPAPAPAAHSPLTWPDTDAQGEHHKDEQEADLVYVVACTRMGSRGWRVAS